jgi:hypothetical protein
MLDDNVEHVVEAVLPFVNETIWIGKMKDGLASLNNNGYHNAEYIQKMNELEAFCSERRIKSIFDRYVDNPKIRFKNSLRHMMIEHYTSKYPNITNEVLKNKLFEVIDIDLDRINGNNIRSDYNTIIKTNKIKKTIIMKDGKVKVFDLIRYYIGPSSQANLKIDNNVQKEQSMVKPAELVEPAKEKKEKKSGSIVLTDNFVNDHKYLFERCYDQKTKQPIELKFIESRIQKNFNVMNKITTEIMIDLYFIKMNWKYYYKRKESFKDYVIKSLPFSREYVYDIIKSISLLSDFSSRSTDENVSSWDDTFIENVVRPLEKVGVSKLKLVGRIQKEEVKNELMERLVKGEEITRDEIIRIQKEAKPKPEAPVEVRRIEMEGDKLAIEGEEVLDFTKLSEKDKGPIMKMVLKYFKQNSQPNHL